VDFLVLEHFTLHLALMTRDVCVEAGSWRHLIFVLQMNGLEFGPSATHKPPVSVISITLGAA
jgi:hypothetical protein